MSSWKKKVTANHIKGKDMGGGTMNIHIIKGKSFYMASHLFWKLNTLIETAKMNAKSTVNPTTATPADPTCLR